MAAAAWWPSAHGRASGSPRCGISRAMAVIPEQVGRMDLAPSLECGDPSPLWPAKSGDGSPHSKRGPGLCQEAPADLLRESGISSPRLPRRGLLGPPLRPEAEVVD